MGFSGCKGKCRKVTQKHLVRLGDVAHAGYRARVQAGVGISKVLQYERSDTLDSVLTNLFVVSRLRQITGGVRS